LAAGGLAVVISIFVSIGIGKVDGIRTGPATAEELAALPRPRLSRPTSVAVPVLLPELLSGGVSGRRLTGALAEPIIDVEAYLAEVPANFQPNPESTDHNSLRRQHGVRVINLPHLLVPSRTWAELKIADVAIMKEANAFIFRVLPTWDRGRIAYQLEINNGRGPSPEKFSSFSVAGIAKQGEPKLLELDKLPNGNRLVGFVVFRQGNSSAAAAAGGSPSASISNPEFQQVLSISDADESGMVFFDFETGRARKPPTPVSFEPDDPTRLNFSPGLQEWIRQEGMDVLFVLRGKYWHAISLDLKEKIQPIFSTLDVFGSSEFASMVAPLDRTAADSGGPVQITASVYYIAYEDSTRSPAAAFCTRKGTRGLFKWTSVTDPTPGVKVRYRLWRG